MPARVVTLTTDFGTRDPYVAAMKGVVSARCPGALIHDLTHEIAPQDLREAALFLSSSAPWFPADTVHIVVVDPGVGTNRRAIAVRAGEQYIVCPDNGVLSWLPRSMAVTVAHAIENPVYRLARTSATFHGRDVFAPAGAALAVGVSIEELGSRVTNLVALPYPSPVRDGDTLRGEILHVDRFGNLISTIEMDDLSATRPREVCIEGHVVPHFVATYGEAAPGTVLSLIGSSGRLEVAVNRGSAAETLGLGVGARLQVAL